MHRKFGFRPDVLLRTLAELRDAIANTPFPSRRNLDPSKILIVFLADKPGAQSSTDLLKIKCDPEELHIRGRELYICFPNRMARPKLAWSLIEKTLKVSGTARSGSSVTKLLQLTESLETRCEPTSRLRYRYFKISCRLNFLHTPHLDAI